MKESHGSIIKENHIPYKQVFANTTHRETFDGGYTDNLCIGGTVTASGGLNPNGAFDGNKSVNDPRAWDDNSWFFNTTPNPDEQIQYEFTSPQKVNEITLQCSGTSLGVEEQRRFTLKGSNDGINFTYITTHDKQYLNAANAETFQFENNRYFKFYRVIINLQNNMAGGSGAHIKEIEMKSDLSLPLPVESDKYMMGYQVDINKLYILTNHDPIKWATLIGRFANDDFESGILDTERWFNVGSVEPTIVNGKVGGTVNYGGTGIYVLHNAVATGDFSVKVNYEMTLSTSGYHAGLDVMAADGQSQLAYFCRNNNGFQSTIEGSVSYKSFIGNPNSAQIRLRRSGNILYMEGSLDNSNQTLFRSGTFTTQDIRIRLASNVNVAGSAQFWFDNFTFENTNFVNNFKV